jgi:DNA-binding CsgD family transcriptional regulator
MRSWTTHEIAELKRLSREGVPLREIADRLERSHKATAIQALRVGIVSPRQRNWSTVEIRRARMLYDTGYSPREIAEQLGRSHRSVSAQLTRHGGRDERRRRESKLKPHTTEYALRCQGLTCHEVLIVLGRPSGPNKRRGLAMALARYAVRARLPVPVDHGRRCVDWDRVEAARRELYGPAVQPLDRERKAS